MVEPTHLKNISQNGNLPQIGLKPPPRFIWNLYYEFVHLKHSYVTFSLIWLVLIELHVQILEDRWWIESFGRFTRKCQTSCAKCGGKLIHRFQELHFLLESIWYTRKNYHISLTGRHLWVADFPFPVWWDMWSFPGGVKKKCHPESCCRRSWWNSHTHTIRYEPWGSP